MCVGGVGVGYVWSGCVCGEWVLYLAGNILHRILYDRALML